MRVKMKKIYSAKSLFAFINDLILNTNCNECLIFRGQNNESYRLSTSWSRFTRIDHESWSSDIDMIIKDFKIGLETRDLKSFNNCNRLEALEFVRHYGLPVPCIDFTYSPYIALFFAFNGIRYNFDNETTKYSVLYALDIKKFCSEYIKNKEFDVEELKNINKITEERKSFLNPSKKIFKNGFPENVFQFIPYPRIINKRMQAQYGCLLYDTYRYKDNGFEDLEDYIDKMPRDTLGEPEIILTKIFIDQRIARHVFKILELMNMLGGALYMNAEGVALDVKNTYNYNKIFSLSDVKLPKIKS